ncbi:hypothetical protein [Micromonospora sp. CB01531]|uniref:hypothetical protein n=1 Tax=Micromonospora sp. CB01531 TaxID=1718947 RepID=UPI00093A5D4B|nr:hypothetical protein [Micromonospora sp. CB01531]OKI51404.1 hypothetical protein A6A27_33560 [Micromonospora sp. CB01531]
MSDDTTPGRTEVTWQTFDLSGLADRLAQARALLEQAAALAATQDAGRITAMAHLQEQLGKEHDAHDLGRRRYR